MSSSANPTPVVVHVLRPYADEQEYLSAEAWSIEARGMLLIDARPLPPETPVLFDVSLAGGQKPIRAEGRVVGSVSARGERPGGLRVRFRRFGTATKAFIEKAVALRGAQAVGATSARVSLAPEPERVSVTEVDRVSVTEVDRVSVTEVDRVSVTEVDRVSVTEVDRVSMTKVDRVSVTEVERATESDGAEPAVPPPQPRMPLALAPEQRDEQLERARRRAPGPVAAPLAREELLERLRKRSGSLAS